MQIIGITGTYGAGKGTIVEYLEKKGFVHYSVSGYLRKHILDRGLEVNRDTMIQVSNDLRKKYGPAYLVEQVYQQAKKSSKDCIIESIRTVGEIELLRKQDNFTLRAVDADQKTRYERIQQRKSEKDAISFEKFRAQEQQESTSTEPHKHNLFACIQRADIIFNNDGNISDLHRQIDSALER